MPKRVFFPLTLVIMGLILVASRVGLIPGTFWEMWPLILIVVGLGGLVLSDKEEWDGELKPRRSTAKPKTAKKKAARRKTTRKSAKKK